MNRQWKTIPLAITCLVGALSLLLATCRSAPTVSPTLAPTALSPTPVTASPTTIPTWTPTPTLEPTNTFTPRPSATPRTTTPTWTPTLTATLTPENTPEPLGNPQLVGVSTPVTDTTAIPTSVPPIQVAPGAINIAVLGSDRREDWEDWHTDVVQIVSIQPDLPSVTILSVPRDLYLYIPGFWMSRINFADMYGEVYKYEGGGPALLQQTLLYNLGIPIHHYVRTDFDGLTGIVNAIGGIDVPVPCRLQDHWYYPDENGEYPIKVLEPGVRHMDGDWALWYARSRLTSSVFDRERRQQQVLEAIWRKARSLELLPRIPELWSQFDSMISTDMDLTTVLELAQIFFRLDSQNVRFRNIGRQQVIPWTTPHGGSVFLPNWPEMEPVISEALAPVPEGRLWRQLQIVEVWNGSQAADWDQLAADRLLHEGFTAVISPADRQDYAQTRLIDFTGATKGSSIPYLQRMFNVSSENVIVAPDPNMAVQYRLIIGADYQTCPY